MHSRALALDRDSHPRVPQSVLTTPLDHTPTSKGSEGAVNGNFPHRSAYCGYTPSDHMSLAICARTFVSQQDFGCLVHEASSRPPACLLAVRDHQRPGSRESANFSTGILRRYTSPSPSPCPSPLPALTCPCPCSWPCPCPCPCPCCPADTPLFCPSPLPAGPAPPAPASALEFQQHALSASLPPGEPRTLHRHPLEAMGIFSSLMSLCRTSWRWQCHTAVRSWRTAPCLLLLPSEAESASRTQVPPVHRSITQVQTPLILEYLLCFHYVHLPRNPLLCLNSIRALTKSFTRGSHPSQLLHSQAATGP